MEQLISVPEQYAIFEEAIGSKQYQAVVGKTVAVEKIEGEVGTVVTFDRVLFRKTAEGKFEFGKPLLKTTIKATIVRQTQGPKLIIFKFKRRKKSRVKNGHRQPVTVVRIEAI